MLDSRAAWIDPRRRRREEEKGGGEGGERREARQSATSGTSRRRRASSSGRASTPRDGTESVSGAPRSPTIEKETEPNGDETARRRFSAATESKRLDAASGTSETRRVSLGEFVRLGAVSLAVSLGRLPGEPVGVTFARVVAATAAADIEVSFGSSADFGVRYARGVPATSTRRGVFPPRRRVRIASGVGRNAGVRAGVAVFSVPGSPVLGAWVSSPSATLDMRKNVRRRSRPSAIAEDVDAPRRLQCLRTDFRTPNLNPGR